MEIYKNSILITLKIIFLSFSLSKCKSIEIQQMQHCQSQKIQSIIDSIKISENQWLAIQMNPFLKDYRNEFLNQSKIYLIELKKSSFEYTEIPIMNRDDYPLKPVSIAYDNKKKEIFLLNIALKTQRSIEIYELKNKSLIYKNRFRSPKFKNLISITIFKDQMVGLNYNGFSIFFWRKGVLFIKKDSKGFEYILEKARYATKLKAINDKLFVVVPKEKKILMFDENFNFYRQLNFDEYPLDIEFFMDNYLISLSKKYLNVFEGLEVDEIKSLDTYFYIISRNDLDYKESFRKNESFIKKLKLRNFYSHSFFSYQSMKLNLFLHHYSLSSIICEI